MLNNEFLQDLSDKIARLVPMAAAARDDAQKHIQEVLQKSLSGLNLVTREEFDAQLKVLERAEQTIATLEEKITLLEKSQGLSQSPGQDSEEQ